MAYDFQEAVFMSEEYKRHLLQLDAEKRRKWLCGDWDITESASISPKAWQQVQRVVTRMGAPLPVGHQCRNGCVLVHSLGECRIAVQCREGGDCALSPVEPLRRCTWDDWKPARDV